MAPNVDEPTWFRLHDFTVTSADLALGTVLKEWSAPSSAIFVPGDEEKDAIDWPEQHPVFTEAEHDWNAHNDRSSAANILVKFFESASFQTDLETERRRKLTLGKVDLKIKKFLGVRPFKPAVLKTIVDQEAVSNYINSGTFKKKDVYIVTALRLADKSFDVGKESNSADHVKTKASASADAPNLHIESTAGYAQDSSKAAEHSYKTAQGEAVGEGVVYAYQMYIIREERKQPGAALFSHKKGFMTGANDSKTIEAIPVTRNMEGMDPNLFEDIGAGEYLYVDSGAKQTPS